MCVFVCSVGGCHLGCSERGSCSVICYIYGTLVSRYRENETCVCAVLVAATWTAPSEGPARMESACVTQARQARGASWTCACASTTAPTAAPVPTGSAPVSKDTKVALAGALLWMWSVPRHLYWLIWYLWGFVGLNFGSFRNSRLHALELCSPVVAYKLQYPNFMSVCSRHSCVYCSLTSSVSLRISQVLWHLYVCRSTCLFVCRCRRNISVLMYVTTYIDRMHPGNLAKNIWHVVCWFMIVSCAFVVLVLSVVESGVYIYMLYTDLCHGTVF